MFKRLVLILATVVAGILGATAVATPAQAAPTCPVGYLCWFDLYNWQGVKYMVLPDLLVEGACYNMGTDPNTGINWNDIIDSVWWNDTAYVGSTNARFYENANCTGTLVTQPYADGHVDNQMQSCQEPVTEWNGPCGPPSIGVAKRISSFKFTW